MNNNPFIQTLVIPYIRYIKRDVTNMKLIEGLDRDDSFDVEIERYSRIYRNTNNFFHLTQLRANAIKLVLWIVYTIPESGTYIKLEDKELCEVFQCSDRQIQRMRLELTSKAIIAKRQYNEYWINPRYFSSGDRLKLYPEQSMCNGTVKLK